jgi:hypothetical protein
MSHLNTKLHFMQLINDIAKRLIGIAENLEENESINLDSLDNFWEFIFAHKNLRLPGITLTNEDYVKAIWQKDTEHIFWIEFYPDKTVKFLHFNKQDKCVGNSTVGSIMSHANILGATEWMINADIPSIS